jgi:hypothetical protein
VAAATRRIGLALTLSTTFYPPFLLARLLTTLDHLSRGRMAWNVVTSYKHEEVLNFGYQGLLDHDQRYDRADVSGCLWDSGAALHARRGRRGAGAAGEGEVRGAACRGVVYALLTRLRRLYAPGTLPCPCRWSILALEAAPAEAAWSCAGVGAYDG